MNTQSIKKTSKPTVIKSCRLFDFHFYDETPELDEEDEEDEEENKYTKSKKDNQQFVIQMFGINEKGETYCIYVNDYLPFFYIKVGDNWTNATLNGFIQTLTTNTKLDKRFNESIVSYELINKHKLYGFSGGNTHRFAKISFKNVSAMNKYKNLWFEYNQNPDEHNGEYRTRVNLKFKGITIELYESNIPPLLRYFHINNVSPSGWVYFKTNRVIKPFTNTTTCKFEYICSYKNLIPMPEKETRVPYKICSFDCEMDSSHGDFPIPIKSYKRMVSNMVDVFIKQSNVIDANKGNVLITKIILTAFGFDTFDDIDNVFPKQKPSKTIIETKINKLLNEPIKDIELKDTNNSSYILTIDSMFDKMSNAIDNEGGDGSDTECNQETTNTFYRTKKPKQVKVDKKIKLIDILLNKTYDRDTKIQITNNTITNIFPQLKGDQVTFIGSTFMKYGDTNPYLNHCIVLNSCDDVPGVQIECVNTERELLLKWTELIQNENPDIIIGYNIFGFDYEFMFRRAQENNCEREFLLLSRKKDELCATTSRDNPRELNIEHTTMKIASGEYDLRFAKMTGRLQIDLYAYFRRDFNLSSYKLDDVAGQFIGDNINNIVNTTHTIHGDVCELYSKNLMGLNIGDFIHIEIIGFTSDYYNNGYKFKVLDIEINKPVIEIVKGVECVNNYNIIIVNGHHDIEQNKSIKWGMSKDDVSPQDIFRLSKGSSSDRAIVAKYCIQDCNLVHHLMNKIDILTGYVEMSKICSVPISFLVFRGQGIKLTSFVAKKCREKNALMPDLEKSFQEDGYEGAIVLPPKCAMYMDNPVACVDYSSLYPSAMISQNYSHDSKVWSKEYNLDGELIAITGEQNNRGEFIYDNLKDYQYINIEFDTYKYIRKSPTSKAEKTKVGKKVCRWAQLPNNKKGIMPSILEELLRARKSTRNMIKSEKDPFMQNILDKRQLGYKVTANSLYGQCGARTSTFYEQDVAASTTATGRMMIIYAKRIIEEVYGNMIYDTIAHGPIRTKAEYVYGDSVAEYTPIFIRVQDSQIECITIDNLSIKHGNNNWILCSENGKQDKEYCELNYIETWTENGWTKLHRIIRHKLATHKKMIRVLTHTGLVDVTDDHSLLLLNGNEISPNNVIIGTELMHHPNPSINIDEHFITEDEAQIMGFFFGDGSCGLYDCTSGEKSSWALNNASPYIISKYLSLCKSVYPYMEWNTLNTINCSGVYKICPKSNKYGDIVKFVSKYRELLYYEKSKIIPQIIMSSCENIREAFFNGLYDADGDKDVSGCTRIDQQNQISAAHISWLASSLGWKTSINIREDKDNIYRITMTKHKQRKKPYSVKKMKNIDYDGYVYDLTTSNHHFAAGIGNMIVHNTDSVFFTFNLENPNTGEKIKGKPALEMTIEIAQDAANLCTKYLKPPMGLEYEKTLMPFILLSKKRYVGILYETNPNKGNLKYMGLSLKRRDSCDYLKDVYGGILNILMKENNIQPAIDFLNKSLNDLISGNVGMDKLTITKALRSGYKNPNQIGHKVLAERIGKRDPGNKPKPGDRMKFVFFVNEQRKALMGDKIETTEFIIENKLKIDYTHYITNQIMKPLQQLFGLAIEDIWKNQNKKSAIKTYHKDMIKMEKEFTDLEIFMKKKEKYCASKVKLLLFDSILNQIYNEKNNIQQITTFFKR
jgi:DNA polymerase elongation subunit (family B)